MKWLVIVFLAGTVSSFDISPEENRGSNNTDLFEGDMILTPKERWRAEHGLDVDSDRKRGASRFRKWAKGILVYEIDSSLAGSTDAVNAIRAGMNDWITKTCIRFKLRTDETSYVRFVFGVGCSSFVGRIGRPQDITLARGCWRTGIVAHEIGHALGFFHEQSRPDRDQFVEVRLENVETDRENNFEKFSASTIDSLGSPYDYGSVMHYGEKFFSKNGLPTLVPKQPGVTIGQRQGLSAIDAEQANLYYRQECEESATTSPPETTAPSTTPPTTEPATTSPPETTAPPTTLPTTVVTTTPAPTLEEAPTTPDLGCQDKQPWCTELSNLWIGLFCKGNAFTQANCKKTCDPFIPCPDIEPWCEQLPPSIIRTFCLGNAMTRLNCNKTCRPFISATPH